MVTSCRPYFRFIDPELAKCGPHSVLASHEREREVAATTTATKHKLSGLLLLYLYLYTTFSLFYLPTKRNGKGLVFQIVNVRWCGSGYAGRLKNANASVVCDCRICYRLFRRTIWIYDKLYGAFQMELITFLGWRRDEVSAFVAIVVLCKHETNSSPTRQKERAMHSSYCHPLLHRIDNDFVMLDGMRTGNPKIPATSVTGVRRECRLNGISLNGFWVR